MSFLSETSASQKVGAFIGLAICGLCARFVLYGGVEEYFNPDKRIENRLVAALEQRPGDLAIMRAMAEEFPLDYDEFLDDMTDAASAQATEADVIAAGGRFLGQFMANHRNDFAAAPTPYLSAVLKSEAAVLQQLSEESPVACDDYVTGRMAYDDPLSADANRLIGEVAAARVHAIAAGRRDSQLRLATTPDDIEALAATMAQQGAKRTQVDAISSGELRDLSYEEECDTVLRLVRAIDAQPDGREALLTATFLAPSR